MALRSNIPSSQATDDSCAGNGGVYDWDNILQLSFEDGVEVLAGTDSYKSIGVCKGREDTNSRSPVSAVQCIISVATRLVVGYSFTYSLEFSNCALTAMMLSFRVKTNM